MALLEDPQLVTDGSGRNGSFPSGLAELVEMTNAGSVMR
jgi:hypothetical protein